MKTTARPAGAPLESRTRGSGVKAWAGWGLLVAVIAVGVMGFFLWIYPAKGFTVPIGWDTSRYIWKTTLAQRFGIANIQSVVHTPVIADPARPGFPAIAATLSSLTGANLFRLAAVLPAVMAASIGLAAAAFVSATLRRPAWEAMAVGVAVGTSAFVVRLAGPEGYQDNLFAAAVFMAAALPLALSLHDRRALLPAVLLFGAGGVIHWAFFLFMFGALGLVALTYLPASWRAWRRSGERLLDTPAARIGEVAVGGALIAGAAIYGVLGAVPHQPKLSYTEFAGKLRRDLPKYRFPLILPLAGAGVASLVVGARGGSVPHGEPVRGRTRFVLAFLLAWCAVVLAGYLGFRVLHLSIPAHRFLAFGLALPLLAALGVLWLARLVGRGIERATRSATAGAVAAAVLVVSAVGGSTFLSHRQWFKVVPWMKPETVQQTTSVEAYLQAAHVATDRPIVFVVRNKDPNFTALLGNMIRASLPAERIPQVYLYAGSPQDYLARRPTPPPAGAPDWLSPRYLSYLQDTYARNPVALILQSTNRVFYVPWAAQHPATVVAPHVAVIRGPAPSNALPALPVPIGPTRSIRLALLAIGALAVLAVVGLGWTVALLGPWLSRLETLALAPAVGVAALATGAIAVDRLGVRLTGPAGATIPLALAAVGGLAAVAASRRRDRRSPDPGAPAEVAAD